MTGPLATRRLMAAFGAAAVLAAGCAGSDGGEAAGTQRGGATTATTVVEPLIAFPDPEWTRIDAVAAGFDPEALEATVAAAEATGSHCLAITRYGRLVGEWNFGGWTSSDTTPFFSATKSMTSTLVGIAQDEGHLDIDDRAGDFIAEWVGTASEDVTIRNLLSNDSGRFWSMSTDIPQLVPAPDATALALSLDQQHDPGAEWDYNNSAIQTLEAVLAASLEEDPVEFARTRLIEPLGLDGTWSTDRSGNLVTYIGFDGTCGDGLRFGNLALAGGTWNGERVVSEAWLDEATGRPSQALNEAYGLLWWRNTDGGWQDVSSGEPGVGPFWEGVPDDAYAALGLGGQAIIVHPSTGVVITRLGPATVTGGDAAPLEIQRLAAAAVVADPG